MGIGHRQRRSASGAIRHDLSGRPAQASNIGHHGAKAGAAIGADRFLDRACASRRGKCQAVQGDVTAKIDQVRTALAGKVHQPQLIRFRLGKSLRR